LVELVRDRIAIPRPSLGILPLQEKRRRRPVRQRRTSDQRDESSFRYGVGVFASVRASSRDALAESASSEPTND
jgi:hypothetical protein